MINVKWQWLFLDTQSDAADRSWDFWSAVTGWEISERRGERGEFATLRPPSGDPWVKLQRVDEGGGVHLDLDVDDVGVAAIEAARLGAVEIGRLGDTVVIMRSPGGFTFCLTTWTNAGSASRQVREGNESLIDQVCLDVPPQHYPAEVEFWQALTGWRFAPSARAEFGSLARPDGMPVRILLQRLQEAEGPVRAHIDLATNDRPLTTKAHLALGAGVVDVRRYWTVLADPVGRPYCLTDRSPATGRLPGS
ncbi:MAG: VOC family protein [Micropruina sp.]|nr:VOC family protein [Micropruina sp.]